MSGPTVVVLPASGEVQHSDQETAEIASTIQHALHEKTQPETENPGPFKQIIAHSDSLYQYINWENPIRTLGLYIGALSIVFGAHYLPLTQVALKAGVTTLGAVSISEFISRLISEDSLSTRLRPKEYKKIPESTLNATLNDIHDLIQYAVVQAQRIIFGQDLDKTFAAFLGLTGLYWLIKVVSPLWLTVMGLTSIFIAPLISSPQGRRAAHDAGVRAQELVNTAAEKGTVLARNSKDKAAELSSKEKQMAADLSSRARDTTSDISGTTAENIRKLPQMGSKAVNEAPSSMSSTFRDDKRNISTSASNNLHENPDKKPDGNRSANDGEANEKTHLSNRTNEIPTQTVPGVNTGRQVDFDHVQSVVSPLPAQAGHKKRDSVADTHFKHTAAEDAAATYSILDRPRGVAKPAMNKS